MIESTTCSDLQTSEKYPRPRTLLEPIDQTIEGKRREVRGNKIRENLPRQSDDPEPRWTQPNNSSHVLVGGLPSARGNLGQKNFSSPVRPFGLDTHLIGH